MNYQGYNRFQEDDEIVECCHCGKQIQLGDALYDDDKYYCTKCFKETIVCCHCGKHLLPEDAVKKNDQDYCEYCYDDLFVIV